MINYDYLNELFKVWIGVGVLLIIFVSLLLLIFVVLFFIYLCNEDDKAFTTKVRRIIKKELDNGSTNSKN